MTNQNTDSYLRVEQEEDVDQLEREGGDEVVLDELLLLLSWQDDVYKGLLLEEDEPVERREEDDTEEEQSDPWLGRPVLCTAFAKSWKFSLFKASSSTSYRRSLCFNKRTSPDWF